MMNQGGQFKVDTHRVGGGARLHAIASKFSVKHEPVDVAMTTVTPVDLYRCETGSAAIKKEHLDSKSEVSIDILNDTYQLLTKKNIKGSLSAFIDTIPGNFDNQECTTLRSLIDRPPIGGREFLPISDQSLLGFRLHPGSLPEQYQLDPPTLESSKPHKKKKKHKHKNNDKIEEKSLDNYSPSLSREHSPPIDPCDFIKKEQASSFFPTPPSQQATPPLSSFQSSIPTPHISSQHQHTIIHSTPAIPTIMMSNSPLINFNTQPSVIVGNKFTGSTLASIPSGDTSSYQVVSASQMIIGTNPMNRIIPPKKKKRHDPNGDSSIVPKKKKKEKKEKRKKKHHLEQPLLAPNLPPTVVPSSQATPPLLHSNYLSRPP